MRSKYFLFNKMYKNSLFYFETIILLVLTIITKNKNNDNYLNYARSSFAYCGRRHNSKQK